MGKTGSRQCKTETVSPLGVFFYKVLTLGMPQYIKPRQGFTRRNKQASSCTAKKKKNHRSIFVEYSVPGEFTLLTPEPPVKQVWFLMIGKIKWNQIMSPFLNTWIWHLKFEILLSLEHSHKNNLAKPFVTVLVCVPVRACVGVSVNWMLTFNCFMDHWLVGHKSFLIGTRQFLNCQINWFWPVFWKDSCMWLWANSPWDHIKWNKQKKSPFGWYTLQSVCYYYEHKCPRS